MSAKANLELRRFASDASINLLRVILMTILGIGISIALARGLGPEGKGIYELVVFLPTVLQALLNIGAQQATIYHVAHQTFDLETTVRGNLTLSFWLSFVGVSVGVMIVGVGGKALFPDIPRELLFLSLPLLPLLYTRPIISAIFQGQQDFRSFSMIELVPYGGNFLGLILTIWWFNVPVVAALMAIIVGNLAAVLYGIRRLQRRLERRIPFLQLVTLRLNPTYRAAMWGYGLKTQFGLMMLFLLFRVDVYLINLIGGGAVSVGLYSVAVVLAERIWLFTGFAFQVMMPRIASWEGEDHKRTELTLMTMRLTFWFSLVLITAVVLLGGFLIQLLFGSDFAPSVNALYLIIPGILMYNFSRVLGADLSARGRPEINSVLFTAALLINIAANLLLIPRFDYQGAAVASSISYSALGFGTWLVFCRLYRADWRQAIWLTADDRRQLGKGLQLMIKRLRRPPPLPENRN